MAAATDALQVESTATNFQAADLAATGDEFTSQEHCNSSIATGDTTDPATAAPDPKSNLIGYYSSCGWKEIVKASVWHGGSWFDAWLTAVAAQVGSVILTFPYTFSQVGYKFGILFQFVYGAFGCWTVFLLSWMYAELKQRKMLQGTLQKGHILQYHEVIGGLVGKWGRYITKTFIFLSLTFGCTLQLIACSSDVYYLNSNWNKRQWLYLFGALALPCVLIPTLHNFRILSFIGIVTTSITSAYMTTAALEHGQIPNVKHSAPDNMVQFFSGLTNILFAFGSHGLCVEIMEAMWKPKNYKYAYVCCVLYTYLLTIPNSTSVYWAYGDILLHNSNAFGVLPPSMARNVSIIAMIAHQYVALMLNITPIFHMWEKAIGLHLSPNYLLKSFARVPVVCLIWFLALAVPFFGPINSMMGAFLISFSVYIIPSLAFIYVYRSKAAREASVWKPPKLFFHNWFTLFCISGFVATFVLVIGFGLGGWASMTNFVRQINTFGFFQACYQCPVTGKAH